MSARALRGGARRGALPCLLHGWGPPDIRGPPRFPDWLPCRVPHPPSPKTAAPGEPCRARRRRSAGRSSLAYASPFPRTNEAASIQDLIARIGEVSRRRRKAGLELRDRKSWTTGSSTGGSRRRRCSGLDLLGVRPVRVAAQRAEPGARPRNDSPSASGGVRPFRQPGDVDRHPRRRSDQDPAYVPAMLAKLAHGLRRGHRVALPQRFCGKRGCPRSGGCCRMARVPSCSLVRPVRGRYRDYSCGFRATAPR